MQWGQKYVVVGMVVMVKGNMWRLVNYLIYKKKNKPGAQTMPDTLFVPIFVTADKGRGSRMCRGAKNMWWWVYMVVMVKENVSWLIN